MALKDWNTRYDPYAEGSSLRKAQQRQMEIVSGVAQNYANVAEKYGGGAGGKAVVGGLAKIGKGFIEDVNKTRAITGREPLLPAVEEPVATPTTAQPVGPNWVNYPESRVQTPAMSTVDQFRSPNEGIGMSSSGVLAYTDPTTGQLRMRTDERFTPGVGETIQPGPGLRRQPNYETSFTNAADRAAFERTPTGPTGTQLVPSQRQWYGAGTGLRGAEPTARSLEDMTLGELFVTGLGTRARRSEVLNQTAMEQNALMARGQDINLATSLAATKQAQDAAQAKALQGQQQFALDVADKASLGSLRQAQAEQARRGKLIPLTVEEPTGQVDRITGAPITTKKQYLYNSDTGETIDPQASAQSGAPAVPSQVAIDEMTKAKRNNAPNLKEMEAEYLATFGALPY